MLDATDSKLLNLLQKNSKQSTKQLSLELNLSVTAVYERIKKIRASDNNNELRRTHQQKESREIIFGLLPRETHPTQ